ncbi:MAG: hypothetical protein ACF8PG_02010 [Maioricimonas sp. JB045]
MSEYQFVAFRAVDAPVSGDDLEFMREQSSRAEITPHEFTNEYHYGDFHGDAEEMLRRGYDVHLHYANFGIRKIMIRLPGGLPDPEAASHYLDGESLAFTPDDAGPGGILRVAPYFESGILEDYWDHWKLIDHLKTLRQEILDGDLRPLYIAALAVGIDDNHDPEESLEPPLPAGMNELTEAQRALAEFYVIDEAIVSVVAAESLPRPQRTDRQQAWSAWIRSQPVEQKDAWLCQLMESTDHAVRRTILQLYRQSNPAGCWPTTNVERTLKQILQVADDVRDGRIPAPKPQHRPQPSEPPPQQSAPQQTEWQRRLATIAANPAPLIRQAEKLIDNKRSSDYAEAAQLLCDLREALAGTDREDLAFAEARRLKEKYPHRRAMIRTLRDHGLLPGR